jgi:hypothetical protein
VTKRIDWSLIFGWFVVFYLLYCSWSYGRKLDRIALNLTSIQPKVTIVQPPDVITETWRGPGLPSRERRIQR